MTDERSFLAGGRRMHALQRCFLNGSQETEELSVPVFLYCLYSGVSDHFHKLQPSASYSHVAPDSIQPLTGSA